MHSLSYSVRTSIKVRTEIRNTGLYNIYNIHSFFTNFFMLK